MEKIIRPLRRVTTLLALPMVLGTSACGGSAIEVSAAQIPAHGVATDSFRASSALRSVDGKARTDIESALAGYVRALRTGDAQLLEHVASAELRQRIATRGPAGNFEERMRAFLIHEGGKLQREVPLDTASVVSDMNREVVVRSIEALDAGSIKAVLGVGGRELPKAFYLVREGGAYKVNVVPPGPSNTVSRYRVQNNDYIEREFSCSDNGPYTIARFPNNRLVNCADSCHGGPFGWFDGTTFQTTIYGTTASTDCDYNTWGVDMYIQFGVPVCADPC
jgi:hypothetical protein